MPCVHYINRPDNTLVVSEDGRRAFCEECAGHFRYPAAPTIPQPPLRWLELTEDGV